MGKPESLEGLFAGRHFDREVITFAGAGTFGQPCTFSLAPLPVIQPN